MSRSIEIDCPNCGSEQNVMIWETINTDVNPDLKQKLFEGQINVFQCQKCETKTFIPVPLLYHDMTKRFCAQFYPFDWLGNNDFLDNFNKQGGANLGHLPLLKTQSYFKQTHIVFEMNELVRYIMFRDRLYGKWEKAS